MSDSIHFDTVEYISAIDAGNEFGVTNDYVTQLCRSGKVSAKRVGQQWYVSRNSIAACLVINLHTREKWKRELSARRASEYHRAISANVGAPAKNVASHERTRKHVPNSALVALSQKIIAGVIAMLFIFGTLAFVDPDYRDVPQRLSDFSNESGRVVKSQFAAASENPSSTFIGFLGSFARVLNRAVDAFVFGTMFPSSISDASRASRVTVRVVPGGTQVSTPGDSSVAVAINGESFANVPRGGAPSLPVERTIVERVIETQRIVSAAGGITEEYLSSRLNQLDSKLASQIYSVSAQSSANATQIVNNFAAVGDASRLERLDAITLANSTITGGSISGASISAASLSVTGTGTSTFSGGIQATALNITSASATSTFALGIDLEDGCFAVDGVCITGSGGTSASSTLLADTNTWSALQLFSGSASTTNFSNFGTAYFGGSATSSFSSTGALTLATPLATSSGGTGISSYAVGDILAVNASGILSRLGIGSTGQVLKVSGGVPAWGADAQGSGGASAWATTSDDLAVYPATPSQVILVGQSATTTTGNILEVLGNVLFRGNVVSYYANTAPTFTATSTTAASTFPYASSTAVSASGTGFFGTASTTNLTISGIQHGLLSTNATGVVSATTTIGTNLLTGPLATVNGTSISAGGSATITAASSTLLANNNTFSGSNTFSSTITGSVSGNAGTATALQTARNINGTSFDGTANITITAASSTALSDTNTWSGLQAFTNSGTTTFSGGTQSTYLNVTGTAATSTFANGLNLTGGCVSVNGTCLGTSNVTNLDSLTDTTITAAAYGDLLMYNGSAWVDTATSSLFSTSQHLSQWLSDETGSGSVVFSNSPTLVTPALGTPSTLVGTNITGTASGLTAGAATALATARTINGTSFDGTANITITAASSTLLANNNTFTGLNIFGNASSTLLSLFDKLYIGNTSGTAATTTLQANTTGTSTIQGILNVAGTNSTSTFSGALASTYLNVTGTAATSTFANGLNLTGGCVSVNGTCLGSGAAGNLDSLTDVVITSAAYGDFVMYNGTNWVDTATSSLFSTSQHLSQWLSDETGTGSVVFSTSPTLVTPNLGTPSALVGTNITGTASGLTAGAATALATARTINGTSFDGTANITITAASSTLLANNNTFSGSNIFSSTITGSVSGNAGTATALQTARNINGTSFDGTANITITAASSTLLANANTWSGLQAFTNSGTTTFSGGIDFTRFSLSATSTGSQGINLTGGCFSINGTCVTGSGSGVSGGAANKVAFFTDATTLSNNTNFHFDTGSTALGVGTSTPRWSITAASSTGPQLALADGANNAWTLRNAGGKLYIATSTYAATSTNSAISIDQNALVTILNGFLTLASSTVGNGTQAGGLTINGGATTTQALVVQGTSASSTFAGNVEVSGGLKVGTGSVYINGASTSTFSSGVQFSSINVTSSSATSTFSNGLQLNGGCFKDAAGNCLTYNPASVTLTQVIASSSPGSNTSFTVPTNTAYIVVEVWGGGGGGGGGGSGSPTAGGAGNQSCFSNSSTSTACSGVSGPLVSASGGSGGSSGATSGAGGAGGAGVAGDLLISGSIGASGGSTVAAGVAQYEGGGVGGSAPQGGGGGGGAFNTAGTAGASFGGGGGGGGMNAETGTFNAGAGGGGGGYAKKIITAPSGTYYYTVGSGGTAGSAGTHGSAGAAGGAGGVTIYVYTTSQLTSSGAGVTLTRVLSATTGTNVTYTPPSNISYIEVETWGAGGGGYGGGVSSGAGTAGGSTCFSNSSTSTACSGVTGPIVSSTGGSTGGDNNGGGGAGGSGAIGDILLTGEAGGSGSFGHYTGDSLAYGAGGAGGNAPLGGGGGRGIRTATGGAGSSYGGGGAGGGDNGAASGNPSGGGGGGGGYARKIITAPSGTYFYTVGSGGSGGAAGTGGTAGGTGGAGGIVIKEYTTGAATAGSVGAGTQGQFAFYNAAGSNVIATSSIFASTASFIGIGTTTPWAQLSLTSPAQQSGSLSLFSVASTTGAHLFDILGNGNVGVGTTTPGSIFSINSVVNFVSSATSTIYGALQTNNHIPGGPYTNNLSGFDLGATASRWNAVWTGALNVGTSTFSLKSDANSNLGFYTAASGGGTQALTITSAGNVGIGTTSPSAKLHIIGPSGVTAFTGTTKFGLLVGGSTAATEYSGIDFGRTGFDTTGAGPVARIAVLPGTNGSYLNFGTSNAYASGITNTAMTIDPSGNVGIGTTSPGAKLQVESGYAKIKSWSTTDYGLILENNAGTQAILGIGDSADTDAHDFFVQTNAGRSLIVGDGGNVGINGTPNGNGSRYLAINGPTSGSSYMAYDINNVEKWVEGVESSNSDRLIWYYNPGGNYRMILTSGGSLSTTDGTLGTISDARLKTNVNDLSATSGLASILQLRPITYEWINPNQGTGKRIGFIAQEVAQIFPSLVSHVGPITASSTMDTLSLNYIGFIPPMVKAIQELDLNLESIASTTASTTPQAQSFVANFFSNLFARISHWLADAANGIGDFFAGRVHTKELCVGEKGNETCVTKSQLDALLAGAAASQTVSAATVNGSNGGNGTNGAESSAGAQSSQDASSDAAGQATSTPEDLPPTPATGGATTATPPADAPAEAPVVEPAPEPAPSETQTPSTP